VNNNSGCIDLTAPTPLAKVAHDTFHGSENQPPHRATYDPLGAPLRELEPSRPHLPPTGTSRRARSAGRTRSAVATTTASPGSRNKSCSKNSKHSSARDDNSNVSSSKSGIEVDRTSHVVSSFCASPVAGRSEARPNTFARVLRPHAPVDPPLVAQRLNFSTPRHHTPAPPAASLSSTPRDSGGGGQGAGIRRSGGQHGSRPSSHRRVVAAPTTTTQPKLHSNCAFEDEITVYDVGAKGHSAAARSTLTPQRRENERSSLPASPSFDSPTPYGRSSRRHSDYSDQNELEPELVLSPSGEDAKPRALFHDEEPLVGVRAMGQVVSGGQLRDFLQACPRDNDTDATGSKKGSSVSKHSRSAEKAPRRTYTSPYEAHDPSHISSNGDQTTTSSCDALKSTQQTIRRPAAPRSAGRQSSSGGARAHRHYHQQELHEPVVVPTPPRGNSNPMFDADSHIDSKADNANEYQAAVVPRPPSSSLSSSPGELECSSQKQGTTSGPTRQRRPHPLHTSRTNTQLSKVQQKQHVAEITSPNLHGEDKLSLKVVGSSVETSEGAHPSSSHMVEPEDGVSPRAHTKTETLDDKEITSASPSLNCTRKVTLSNLDLASFATDNAPGEDRNETEEDGTRLLCFEDNNDDEKDAVAPSPKFDFTRKVNLSTMNLEVDDDDDDDYAEEVFECDVNENSNEIYDGCEDGNGGGSPSFDANMVTEVVAAMAKSGRLCDVVDEDENDEAGTPISPPPFGVGVGSADFDARSFELSAELAAIVDGAVKEEDSDDDMASRRNSGGSSRFSQWGSSNISFEPLVSPRAPAPRKHSMCYFDPTLTVVPEDQAFALFSQSGRHVAANENDDQNNSPLANLAATSEFASSSSTIPATTPRIDDDRDETTCAEDLGATFSPSMPAASLSQAPSSSFQHNSLPGSVDPRSSPSDLGVSVKLGGELIDVVDPMLFSVELPTDTALFLEKSSNSSMWFGESDNGNMDVEATTAASSETGHRGSNKSSSRKQQHGKQIAHNDTYGQWMVAQCAKCCNHDDHDEITTNSQFSPSGDQETPFDMLYCRAFSDLDIWLATNSSSSSIASEASATITDSAISSSLKEMAPVDQPRDAFGNSLFLAACQLGAKRAVKWCVANGADVNAVNRFGNTGMWHGICSYLFNNSSSLYNVISCPTVNCCCHNRSSFRSGVWIHQNCVVLASQTWRPRRW